MEAFVARQPILDRQQQVFAYELFFRSGLGNYYENPDGDQATTKVIANSFWVIGIETLTGGKRGFINFTGDLLKSEVPGILPKGLIGIEVMENVEPDQALITACKKLRQSGYVLALDGYVFRDMMHPLIDLVDIVKIDFLRWSYEEINQMLRQLRHYNIKFLAEKVETQEDFAWAYAKGFSYFQGYYFSKPVIIKGQDIPSEKLTFLMLMKEINKPNDTISFDHIEEVVKRDISLSFNLLRYINSAAFGIRHKVQSIKQALVFLGIEELKKWINLYALKGLSEDKPDMLALTSIIRARFCELMAVPAGFPGRQFDLFLLGMFSMIEVFFNRPKSEVLAEIPVDPDVRDALLEGEGRMADFLDLLVAYEKGAWSDVSALAGKLGINEEEIPNYFFEAVKWANQISYIDLL